LFSIHNLLDTQSSFLGIVRLGGNEKQKPLHNLANGWNNGWVTRRNVRLLNITGSRSDVG
jgi:hypothetical protein